MRHTLISSALVLLAACTTRERAGADSLAVRRDSIRADSVARAKQDSINRAMPGYVIDSLLPPEEEARRFRAEYPGDSATTLVGGEGSRDALVRRFVRSLAAADTNDLRTMVVTPREFVDLYYPGSPYARGPYHQPVGFAWQMIQNPSDAGFRKLLRRAAGQPWTFVRQRCEPKVSHDGAVDRYSGCLVRIVDARGDSATKRLFGSIVSYRGAFKFLSYTNDM
ncbi:MAG: hypothetical protein ACJ79A_01810 [Gemmatimonadaceae bacterium]